MIEPAARKQEDQSRDPHGTAYNREAGFACRVCGTIVRPLYMGNALMGYRCPKCEHEIEP